MTKTERTPLTPEQVIRHRRQRLADRRAAWALGRKAVFLLAAVYLLFGVLFGLTPMRGGDMQPRFAAGDLLLYYRLPETYLRGDVVVMVRDGETYVGRVIGLPGDTVDITDEGELLLSGRSYPESDIFFKTEPYQGATAYPLTLEAGEYFLLGDHRPTARDSRYFGAVRHDELRGKVITAIRRVDL